MIPPAALTIFALVYNSVHEEELKQLRAARDVEKTRISEERDSKIEGFSDRMLGDLHALRAELEAVRSEVARMRESDGKKLAETGNVQTTTENAKAHEKGEPGPGSATSTSAKLVSGRKDPEESVSEDTSVPSAVAKDGKK